MPSDPMQHAHELVLGIVGAVGTDLSDVSGRLSESLAELDYKPQIIRLSKLLHDIESPPWAALDADLPEDERISRHMDAGDELRRILGNDAMAMLAVGSIMDLRQRFTGVGKANLDQAAEPVDGTARLAY